MRKNALSKAIGLILCLVGAVGCHSPLHARGARADGSVASGTGGTPTTGDAGPTGELVLVAGKLGGPGDLDGIGTKARFRGPSAMAKDGAGHLFVTDGQSHVIRQVDLKTGAVTTLAGSPGRSGSSDGVGAAARFNDPVGIAADGAGNLFVSDSADHTIRKIVIATGAVTTVAGSAGTKGDRDGVGSAAEFDGPSGIASDRAGTLYVADSYSIRTIDSATGTVTTLAGTAGKWGSVDGVGADARFRGLFGVVYNGSGRLFVADRGNGLIRGIDVATGKVTTLAGSAPSDPYGPALPDVDGIGSAARFAMPAAITIDDAGNLFVGEMLNGAIRKVVIASAVVTTVARLSGGTGVVEDGAGNLFVTANMITSTIQKIVLATGETSTFAGSEENRGLTDGIKDEVRFGGPWSIASDSLGTFFVADGAVVRTLAIATGTVTTIAGSANEQGAASVDGIGIAARFTSTRGIASDDVGHLFVTDMGPIRRIDLATGAVTTLVNGPTGDIAYDGAGSLFGSNADYTIDKFDIASGAVTTLAGLARAGGGSDGIGTAALFWNSHGIACDGAGHVYVADSGNNTIRQIDVATTRVTTLAGLAGAAGYADGIGASARFDNPVGLVYDKKGNLYVGDVNNRTIRKIVIATQTVSTVAGTPGRMGVVLGPLPAGLSNPASLAMAPSGELLIGDPTEHAVLAVRF